MSHKTQLLSTVILGQPLVTKAAEGGMTLDCVSFIEVAAIDDAALMAEMERLCSMNITAVFTSVNAVKAVSKLVYIAKPNWQIYCIGNATKNALLDYFNAANIKGTANNAAQLAEIILMDDVNNVVFFCGDRRTDILPGILKGRQVLVHEMIVYKTTETPKEIDKEYDGVLFFSPSAAESFFSVNTISTGTVLFAIGNTTADAIKSFCANKVIVGDNPSKSQLVERAVQYFHKEATVAVKN